MQTLTRNPATARPVRKIETRTEQRPAFVIDGRQSRGRKVGGGGVRSHILGNCAPNKPVTSLYQTGVIWMTV